MMKEFDINKYKMLKNELKQRYIDEKLGNQQSYESQAKLLKPIIDTTRETSKNLEQKIDDDRQNLNNVLIPFTNQIMRANDQREAIQAMPFYTSDILEDEHRESTPKKDILIINLDKDLNETDIENLQDLSLPLPSEAYRNNEIDQTLQKVKTENQRIGQYLRDDSKKTEVEKKIYKSRKETLQKYKDKLKKVVAGSELVAKDQKIK